MNFLETYGKEIVSLIVPLITLALNTFFKAKAKLLLASPHTFTFIIQQPLLNSQGNQISPVQTIHTISHVINNVGKETATKIELLFNWKPLCINFWPPRHYSEQTEPDGRYTLIFDSLAPNEVMGCELLTLNSDLPSLLVVRSDQCVAKTITMYPQPMIKNWQRRISIILVLAGLSLVVYLAIWLLQFLVLKTPFGH
jgi:hypothetical protein